MIKSGKNNARASRRKSREIYLKIVRAKRLKRVLKVIKNIIDNPDITSLLSVDNDGIYNDNISKKANFMIKS